MRRRGRLARKYLVILVGLVTGALLVSGAVEIYYSYNENKAALVTLQREKASGAASRIETFVREIERQLVWTTQPLLVPTPAAAIEQRRIDAVRLQRQVLPITEVSHLDARGREQLRVSRLAMDVVGSQTDYSGDPKFRVAKSGRTYFGPVYFRKESEPYMTIAMPQAGGGVTVAEVNLKFIWDVVSQIKVGKAGLAYVVDGGGALIAHPDISLVLQKTSLAGLDQVKTVLAGVPGAAEVTIARDLKGREVLTAHSVITPLGWVVFVEQPLEEAFETLRSSAYRTALLVALGIGLAAMASAVLARRLARPIQALQVSAAKIGAGELDHQIAIKTGDELEALADEFNRMTGRLRESYATLEQRVEDRTHELSEALEQQTATAEILRVISSSPTNLQPVMEALVESAARLCEAQNAQIFRVEGDQMRLVARYGPVRSSLEAGQARPLTRASVSGRAILDRAVLHIPDLLVATASEYPDIAPAIQREGIRTTVGIPLLREGLPIGAITAFRTEVRPFNDKQIALLQIFADQAVIAIENVRLFTELDARNADLSEALNQQTATAEILRVISSSPTDVQPVFDTIVQRAVGLLDGLTALVIRVADDQLQLAALTSTTTVDSEAQDALVRANFPIPLTAGGVAAHVVQTRRPYTIADTDTDPLVTESIRRTAPRRGYRSMLFMPMVRDERVIGLIVVTRRVAGAFSDDEVGILGTFADQAVIAIENVRLFTELETRNAALTEALDQQTATAEILRVISSSPTDVRPVLDAVAESAARLCGANDAFIMRVEGGMMRPASHFGDLPLLTSPAEGRAVTPEIVGGRAVLERRTIHIHDASDESVRETFPETYGLYERLGMRTVLATPLLRDDGVVGVIVIRRLERRPFTDKQIALLQTFAAQAVIAIENVRLFAELEEKNRTITEALDQQTATAEILRVISSSPTDVQPVLDAVAENATRVCEAGDGAVLLIEGRAFRIAAHYGAISMPLDETVPIVRGNVAGRAVLEAAPVQVPDLLAAGDDFPEGRVLGLRFGNRTTLATPLLREGTPIGALLIRRTEVRPFTDKQIVLLQTFADQAVIAIENVRLFTELQSRTAELTRSVGELEALGEVGRAISSTLDLETVLATIVARATELAEGDGGVLYEFDEASRAFHLRATDRFPEEFVAALRATRLVYGEGAAGRAVATREPVQVADVTDTDAYSSSIREVLVRSGYRSLLAVPLVSEDEVVGALVIDRRTPGAFAPRTVELLRTFASQSALAIQNARLFHEIEDKSRELEVASRHKDEFLASMSHELRTPLNAIIGFSEVMIERMFGDVNPKQEEYLNDILSSGRHLLSLINDILDLAKIEAGRMELEPADFHLPQAIDNALVLIRERALRRGIALEQSIDPRLGEIKGDERKVKQVLLNLLSNAVKFTHEGGRIDVRARLGDGVAEISVADTGVGIAPEDHAAVFEEFRQVGTDYARKHEGTGLGLALARKFVELHGGKIWVESQVGQGATFTFTIPVRPWQAS